MRAARGLLIALVLFGLVMLTVNLAASPGAAEADPRPNVVVILTDDMRADELRYMPNVNRLLAAEGLTYSNAYVSNPHCCPSRSSILTGNYSHTTGVYTNGSGEWSEYGGYEGFMSHGNDPLTFPVALDGAGYRTGLFGKSLNGQGADDPALSGFDTWLGLVHLPGTGRYLDYFMNRDGTITEYGHAAADYSTDVFAADAVEFITSVPSEEPLLAYYAPSGPHSGVGISPRRYDGDAEGLNRLRGPAFNERNVKDKPRYIRSLPRLDGFRLASVLNGNEERVEALWAVDDAVGDIVQALDDSGRLENTVILFMSDNGHQRGEHRWSGKQVPYESSLRVPLVIRFDALGLSGTTDSLAANVDLAETIAELTGTPLADTDGVSLVRTFSGGHVRSAVLVEHLNYSPSRYDAPTLCGLRTAHRMFTRYATGELELYNMRRDPHQLVNLARHPTRRASAIIAKLDARLRRECSPLPPGMSSW